METRTELSLRLSALADEVAEIAQSLEEDHGMDDAAAALDYAIEKIREARMLARPGVCRMDADTLKEQFAKAAADAWHYLHAWPAWWCEIHPVKGAQ